MSQLVDTGFVPCDRPCRLLDALIYGLPVTDIQSRGRHDSQALFGNVQMHRTLTWVHLSDLHYCAPETGWDADRVFDSLLEDLSSMRRSHDLHPDLILFTGDCAFGHLGEEEGRSIRSQFAGAADLFERLRQNLQPRIPIDNFFIVPGNHDVNRKGIPASTWSWLDHLPRDAGGVREVIDSINRRDSNWELFMRRLEDYKTFLGDSGYEHLLRDPDRLVYAELREVRGVMIGIAGLNSAWSSGRDNEKSRLWFGGDWQIKYLNAQLKGAHFAIALMHHPPSWSTEAESAATTIQLQSSFDFFLHGHEHNEWVAPLATGHTRIAAGACYARSRKETAYNIVRVDFDSGTSEVWLRRYEDKGRSGWVPLVVPGQTNNDGRLTLPSSSRTSLASGHRGRWSVSRVSTPSTRCVDTSVRASQRALIGAPLGGHPSSRGRGGGLMSRLDQDRGQHAGPTSAQVRHFIRLLRLAVYDCELERNNAVQYFIDADVAVRMIAGFEDENVGSTRAQLLRALVASGQVGQFRMLRPHAFEMYEFIERRDRDSGLDRSYQERVNAFIAETGIEEFLTELNEIGERYGSAKASEQRQCVADFIAVLRRAGEEKFVAIEALRGPWRRRTRSLYSSVLVLDSHSMGPEMRDRTPDDLASEDRVMQFLERHSDRSYGSNYRDACALAILSRKIKERENSKTAPLVRFYSETSVVRAACTSDELADLFDERSAIGATVYESPLNQGVFRDTDYFLMRVRFPELNPFRPGQASSLDELIRCLRRVRIEQIAEPDLTKALADVCIGDEPLSDAIEEFEQLRLMRALWTSDSPPIDAVDDLRAWSHVFLFARDVTKEALDVQIDDIQKSLRESVIQLQEWLYGFERIQRISALRRREGSLSQMPQGMIDDPMRELGLSRWGVRISAHDLEQAKKLIASLYDADSMYWHDACRHFASQVQQARNDPQTARMVCSVLWALREYRWIDELLEDVMARSNAKSEPDLVVWRGAAWIRSTRDLERQSGKDALRTCLRRLEEIREAIAAASDDERPFLVLGLGYVLFHCWKRVDPTAFRDDETMARVHRGWVDESISLAKDAKRQLPRNSLPWGLAVNHCAYVYMESGGDLESVLTHMRDLVELEPYGIWNARFADTSACYYMWRAEQEMGHHDRTDLAACDELLRTASEYLHNAQIHSIGDIAVRDHQIRLDGLRVKLQQMRATDR